MPANKYFRLLIAVAVSELAGVIGGLASLGSLPVWYANLAKPALTPPPGVFGPVWTALYATMGIALFLIWQAHDRAAENPQLLRRRKIAIGLFFVQLALNSAWSIIFFGLQSPGWALVEILVLWLAIAATALVFHEISRKAAYLFVPYLLWVTFAVYLNFSIWALN